MLGFVHRRLVARAPSPLLLRGSRFQLFSAATAADGAENAAAVAESSTSEETKPPAQQKKVKVQSPPAQPPTTTWSSLVVGEIVAFHPHPTADRLNVCQVNVGDKDNLLQIICGAPNVREGARVPVATIGTKLALKDPESGDM